MNVWLITLMHSFGCTIWEDARNLKFITMVNGRFGEKRIGTMVEQFYASEVLDLGGLVEQAHHPVKRGIRAVKVSKGIICGDNPFVFARKVELVDIRQENGVEKLIWREGGVVRALKRWDTARERSSRRKIVI
jgi:hypothetical protein